MNLAFSVGEFSLGGPLGWLLLAMVVLAPPVYVAVARRPAGRGSRRGIWGAAAAYLAVFVALAAGSGLAARGPFHPGITLGFALLLLTPTLLACAAVLHVAARPSGRSIGGGSLALATLLGYLAIPAGVLLAGALVFVTAPGH